MFLNIELPCTNTEHHLSTPARTKYISMKCLLGDNLQLEMKMHSHIGHPKKMFYSLIFTCIAFELYIEKNNELTDNVACSLSHTFHSQKKHCLPDFEVFISST